MRLHDLPGGMTTPELLTVSADRLFELGLFLICSVAVIAGCVTVAAFLDRDR